MVKNARSPFNSEYNAEVKPFMASISMNKIMAKVINTSSEIMR